MENINNTIKELILSISRKKVEMESILDETNLIEDLGFDSILLVQMITLLEDKFDIILEDEDMDTDILNNYGKLKELINRKVG